MKKTLLSIAMSSVIFSGFSIAETQFHQPQVEIVNGVVSPESAEIIFQEMDYQRAVMLYHWAIPMVGTHGWERANRIGNITKYQFGSYTGYENLTGILTPNQVVDYLISFPVLDEPLVWEVPAGFNAGMVMDYAQQTQQQVGSVGPNRGEAEKILLIGPGIEVPKNTQGYDVVHVPTRVAFLGTRNMIQDPKEHAEFNENIKLYPYGQKEKAKQLIPVLAEDTEDGRAHLQRHPRGIEFWQALNEIVQREEPQERDILFLDMLKHLGIEKGKPFEPTKAQQALLVAAEEQGFINASVNSYSSRLKGFKFWEESNWYLPLSVDPTNQHHDLDGKASWYWEAISSAPAMVTTTPGVGSTYLGIYSDEAGHGFDGCDTYSLDVPDGIPAKQFWTMTLYNNATRSLLLNETHNAELGSLSNLMMNEDGSATLTFSPEKNGAENWIQTNCGEDWFAWFRLYQPEQAYFDKDFFLPNVKKAQ
ncbi:DUF1214 domain-containing protein [Vibrio lamellibrachiae]|uniref:DUF1214 domain-containing protein n=1 Tax=Vibrio lamellibrachiae TaxID=2910253 RepID=UPI003D0EA4EB